MKFPKIKKWLQLVALGLILVLVSSFVSFVSLRAEGKIDDAMPRTPQGLSLKLEKGEYKLTWVENEEWDIFSYVVYIRSSEEKTPSKTFLTGKRDDYVLADLKPKKSYFVSLAARDIGGNVSPATHEVGFVVSEESGQSFSVNGWVPATADLLEARTSFRSNADIFETISPFVYSMEPDGNISKLGEVMTEEMLEAAKENNVKVIPAITNNFDKDKKASSLLRDGGLVEAHVAVILKTVEENGYDGIDIDYENLDPNTEEAFTAFIGKLAEKLHEKGKFLSVTLQPKKDDSETWVGAYNYEALGEVADQVRIMTYDYARVNTVPGPVAPLSWFKEVLEYSKEKIPAEKVIAGVPFYGYRWCTEAKNDMCQNGGLVWSGVQNVIRKYDPLVEWNAKTSTPWFMYTDEHENNFVVHFEDHQSLSAKIEVVKKLGLGGVAIWRLGSEDPQNFDIMADKFKKEEILPPNLQVVAQDKQIYLSWSKGKADLRGYRIFHTEKDGEERYVDVLEGNEYIIPGLENGKTYFVSLMPLEVGDEIYEGSYLISEREKKKSLPFVVSPQDLAYPGNIDDLKVEKVGTSTIDLSFTVPGDEYFAGQVERLEIRYSEKPLDEDNFDKATQYQDLPTPKKATTKQNWQLQGLEGGIQYHIAMRAFDEAGNPSNVSNVVKAKTIDVLPPKVPEIEAAVSKDKSVELIWKPNTERDLSGYKVFFKQEKEAYDVLKVGKNVNHILIPELENNYNYYFSITALDVNGNESGRSKDYKIVPKASGPLKRASEEALLEKEKIKGSIYLFSRKLVNKEALPYLAMFAVIVLNFLIYYSFREEIRRILQTRSGLGVKKPQLQRVKVANFERKATIRSKRRII
ncbi:hypothetical protein KKC60_00695 [Patescibacteria group bacterium]|nr:hypothetical protein [Patescibacteria group bacterium]